MNPDFFKILIGITSGKAVVIPLKHKGLQDVEELGIKTFMRRE